MHFHFRLISCPSAVAPLNLRSLCSKRLQLESGMTASTSEDPTGDPEFVDIQSESSHSSFKSAVASTEDPDGHEQDPPDFPSSSGGICETQGQGSTEGKGVSSGGEDASASSNPEGEEKIELSAETLQVRSRHVSLCCYLEVCNPGAHA